MHAHSSLQHVPMTKRTSSIEKSVPTTLKTGGRAGQLSTIQSPKFLVYPRNLHLKRHSDGLIDSSFGVVKKTPLFNVANSVYAFVLSISPFDPSSSSSLSPFLRFAPPPSKLNFAASKRDTLKSIHKCCSFPICTSFRLQV